MWTVVVTEAGAEWDVGLCVLTVASTEKSCFVQLAVFSLYSLRPSYDWCCPHFALSAPYQHVHMPAWSRWYLIEISSPGDSRKCQLTVHTNQHSVFLLFPLCAQESVFQLLVFYRTYICDCREASVVKSTCLLSQGTWVQFPALHGSSQPFVNPVPEDLIPSSDLHEHQAHTGYTGKTSMCIQNEMSETQKDIQTLCTLAFVGFHLLSLVSLLFAF